MRRKIAAALAGGALVVGAALAAPAAASAAGYGKQINDGCGASYGQLVSAARDAGHVTGSVGGAKNFVVNGIAAAHRCS
ncbi:hypothetical protein [Microbacterium thalassium]|uniref:DUF732 domain-containing protein n=1 Tax=Microbacterium thalassium TaxID=362649 RepID=A0A7X0KTR3_9MICO|nr:hypothetical protein [Microbacterium thalassium]MBB6390318.1 hypothetical protein [Microbacterium thalassium]GLK25427.1 hypothetical protein GCM10017607_27460 [Microbacterium thalassium]